MEEPALKGAGSKGPKGVEEIRCISLSFIHERCPYMLHVMEANKVLRLAVK